MAGMSMTGPDGPVAMVSPPAANDAMFVSELFASTLIRRAPSRPMPVSASTIRTAQPGSGTPFASTHCSSVESRNPNVGTPTSLIP